MNLLKDYIAKLKAEPHALVARSRIVSELEAVLEKDQQKPLVEHGVSPAFKGKQEHDAVLRAAGVPVEGDGQEHGEIMREITRS